MLSCTLNKKTKAAVGGVGAAKTVVFESGAGSAIKGVIEEYNERRKELRK
jgi:hypothetical protein